MSPFAKRAEQYRLYYKGGKSDDITVVVGQIKLSSGTDSNTQNDKQTPAIEL